MFEVFIRNPAYNRQFDGNDLGFEVAPVRPNPNIPEFITVEVDGISATVEGPNLIIIEGDGTVSAVFPGYEWVRAIKKQPVKVVESGVNKPIKLVKE